MFFSIENYNRNAIQEEYVDYLIGSMDFLEARTALKEYMMKDKDSLTHSELEREVKLIAPSVLYQIFTDEVVSTLEGGYYHA